MWEIVACFIDFRVALVQSKLRNGTGARNVVSICANKMEVFFGGRWVFRMGEVFLPAAKPTGQGTESVVLLPVVVGVTTFILLP